MAIKLIAIDMDGTLLNPQHEITAGVKAAIGRARDKGVSIVLATGRPFVGVERYLMELDLRQPGQYCISNNGALAHSADSGEVVARRRLALMTISTWNSWRATLGYIFRRSTNPSSTRQIKTSANTPSTKPA